MPIEKYNNFQTCHIIMEHVENNVSNNYINCAQNSLGLLGHLFMFAIQISETLHEANHGRHCPRNNYYRISVENSSKIKKNYKIGWIFLLL